MFATRSPSGLRVGAATGRALRRVPPRCARLCVAAAAMCLVAGAFVAPAHAGYAISPNSATTSARPTFTAYVEPQELGSAIVYVAADTQYDSSYYPVHE